MTYNSFKSNLIKLVNEEVENRRLEDITIKNTTIDSPDGINNDRLMVSVGESKMSMAFRLNAIYRDVENGESMENAATKIVNTIEENITVVKTKEDSVKSFVTDYNKVKDHTFLRLIPGNSPILKDTPHKMIVDMALVVNAHLDDFSDENGKSVVVISKPLMEMYGIDEAQLFADAMKNSLANEPLKLMPLHDLLRSFFEDAELPDTEECGFVTYVATNKSGFQGAAVASYPEFCERAAEVIGGGFYMLPSSVHEFILLKDDCVPKAKELSRMVNEINSTVLDAREFLSDHVYHYDAKAKVLEIGTDYDDRLKEAS